jgi:uncharacterized phage protein (TIGR01671 family)
MNNRLKFRVWDNYNIGKTLGFRYINMSEVLNWLSHGIVFETTVESKIQQYTGLKDKNGKEIYEGDIIIFMGRWDDKGNVLESDYQKYTVNWFMGGLWAMTIKKSCRSFHTHNEMLGVGHTDSEVIGNIFETPELLK